MDKTIITTLRETFEEYANKNDGVEFWFARDLQKLLGYVEWRKFRVSLKKREIKPETLPSEQNIKKLQKRIKDEEKKIA